MSRIISVSVLAFFLTGYSAIAAVTPYQMIKEKSSLKFYAIQNNAPVEGKFADFSANILFDSDQLDKSKISVEVSVASVEASYEEVAKNLKLPEWLSVEAFPKANFTSKTITRMPMTNNYYSEGELTLRGKTMPVTINFQLDEKGSVAVAKGFATLHRTSFEVGQGQWAKDDVVKDEIRIEFRIVANKQ